MTIRGLRWWIMALICLGSVTNYLARNSLGIMAVTLMRDMSFSTQQYSYVVGAFQLAYTLMQPVCGIVLDVLGVHRGFFIFALVWSAINCLHGFATSWVWLAGCRGLLGLAEAAAIPAGIKAVTEWFPARQRSVGVGLLNIGTSLGAMLAPPLVLFVQQRYDWSAAFVVTGGLGLVFALLWLLFYRSPERHPWISAGELRIIEDGRPPAQPGARKRPDLGKMLSGRKFWSIALPRFLAEPAWQTFNFWVPLYLATQRGMNIKEIAIFAWLPFLAADLGSLAGAGLSPFFMKYCRMGLINSRLAGIATGALCMIAPGCVGLAGSAYWAIALLCVGGFAHQIISSLLNTLGTDLFSRDEVATANGFTGMASWTGGLSFSLIVGALANVIGFNPLFACLSVFDLIGATIAILLLRDHGSAAANPGIP